MGGLPFEYARHDVIVAFLRARGFKLVRAKPKENGHGCHEFVFRRQS
jgi:hypothetical protein